MYDFGVRSWLHHGVSTPPASKASSAALTHLFVKKLYCTFLSPVRLVLQRFSKTTILGYEQVALPPPAPRGRFLAGTRGTLS